jgi:hypothetical protein
MKLPTALLSSALLTLSLLQAQTTVFNTTFSSGYTNGNLLGQNGWTQTSTTTNNPLQVTSGQAVIGTSGQDAWNAFGPFVTNANYVGGYLQTTISLSLNSAQPPGDFFFHLSSPTNTASNFYQRLYARATNTGFQLGLAVTFANVTNPLVWDSAIRNFSNNYQVVLKWDFIAGASNDVISLFVDPVGDLSNATPDITSVWGTLEPTTLQAVNFRQGASTNAPVVVVNSINVQVVPEPSTCALVLVGAGLAGYVLRRRSMSPSRATLWRVFPKGSRHGMPWSSQPQPTCRAKCPDTEVPRHPSAK